VDPGPEGAGRSPNPADGRSDRVERSRPPDGPGPTTGGIPPSCTGRSNGTSRFAPLRLPPASLRDAGSCGASVRWLRSYLAHHRLMAATPPAYPNLSAAPPTARHATSLPHVGLGACPRQPGTTRAFTPHKGTIRRRSCAAKMCIGPNRHRAETTRGQTPVSPLGVPTAAAHQPTRPQKNRFRRLTDPVRLHPS
jgi:hypothetical protein